MAFRHPSDCISGVARGGFEPPHTAPKTAVLPLDDRAIKPFISEIQMI